MSKDNAMAAQIGPIHVACDTMLGAVGDDAVVAANSAVEISAPVPESDSTITRK